MKLELVVLFSLSFLADSLAFLTIGYSSSGLASTRSKDACGGKRSCWRSCSCSSSLTFVPHVLSKHSTLQPLGTKYNSHAGRRWRGLSTLGASVGDGDGSDAGDVQQQPNLSRGAKLVISVLIDLVGMSSYTLPGLGEITDLGWAPISSALVFYLYGSNVFAGLAFVEEVVPGLDFIPTATIAWFLTNSEVGQNVSNVAGGKSRSSGSASSSASSATSSKASSASSEGRDGVAVGGRANGPVDRNATVKEIIDVEVVEK